MANPYRLLEVVIESARNLENVNRLTRMKPFAVVYLLDTENNLRSSKKESLPYDVGGSDPIWNFNVRFNIDIAMAQRNSYVLVVKLRSCRRTHGARDKVILEVCVPIKDLLDCTERTISRPVSTSSDGSSGSGQGQGQVTFSFDFWESTADNLTLLNIKKKKSRTEVIKKLAKLIVPVALGGLISGLTGASVHGAS